MIRTLTCPICQRPLATSEGSTSKPFPFCSERCRQVDLLRWSKGKYAIIEPLQPDDLDEAQAAQDSAAEQQAGPDDLGDEA